MVAVLALLPGCGAGPDQGRASSRDGPQAVAPAPTSASEGSAASTTGKPGATTAVADRLPGMPPPLDPTNLYAADGPGRLSRVVRGFRPLVYVPNSESSSVDAIDTSSGRLLARIPVGRGPHGLCVYPQPGRYSLGHTGVFR
jgi:YVTN family beta-propeller protein